MFHEGWEVAIGIASVIATGILLYFVMIQTRHTQHSLDLVERDMNARIRPWIAGTQILSDGATLGDGTFSHVDEFLMMNEEERQKHGEIRVYHFSYNVKNYGELPAITSQGQVAIVDGREIPPRTIVSEIPLEERGPLMPNESYLFNFDLETKKITACKKEGLRIFMVFYIKYTFGEDLEESYGQIQEFLGDRWAVRDKWIKK